VRRLPLGRLRLLLQPKVRPRAPRYLAVSARRFVGSRWF
jgi:hypothetical protein